MKAGKYEEYFHAKDPTHETFFLLLTGLVFATSGIAADENPIEIGSVKWGRDLDSALAMSAETGRPLFVLFQEVPGCSGCQDFGRTVLSHPLIVEAVEDEFLPVLIFNNRWGKDRQLLDHFGEPSWNFQVVRFLNADGEDIIPRKDRIWTIAGIAQRMIEALDQTDRQIPKYLQTLTENHTVVTSSRDQDASGIPAIYAVPGFTEGQKARIEPLMPINRNRALEWLSPRQQKSLDSIGK